MYITTADIDHAWRYPSWGRLAYSELFPTGSPTSRRRRNISNSGTLRGLPKKPVITRGEDSDHMSVAL